MFPGIKISEPQAIMDKICHQLNPDQLSPIDNMSRWTQVDNKIYESEILIENDHFYLFYCHPVHEYKNKLYLTTQNELIDFLKIRINPDHGNGLDLIIASTDMCHLIVCNHDGEIYIVR